MTILERLSLIKAGYNRKEIDAMIEEEKNTSNADSSSLGNGDNPAPDESGAGAPPDKTEDTPADNENTSDTSTDDALKDALAEIDKLKDELKQAQEFNKKKDVSDTVDNEDEKTVEDIVRSFM